jgi:WD40 repeat protein
MPEIQEVGNFVAEDYRKYQIKTSIHHWQLRDMIATSEAPGEVIYTHSNTLNILSTKIQKTRTVIKNLVFNPTSMCYGHGFVALGGQRSQLVVKNMQTGEEQRTATGGSINNAVEISRHDSDLRILVCNNDETVKIFSLDSLTRISVLVHKVPVNNCSVSPDGKFLATVCDNNEVNLFAVERGTYKYVRSMPTMNDAAFKVSWNATSMLFAVSTQDGYVCVYDVRGSGKMAAISSRQTPLVKGACRNVKFCMRSCIDVLAFTEHVSHFTVVDTRTFEKKQCVALSSPEMDKHISGIAFSSCGEHLYVGTEMNLFEFGVDTAVRRAFPSGHPV